MTPVTCHGGEVAPIPPVRVDSRGAGRDMVSHTGSGGCVRGEMGEAGADGR